MRGEPKSKRSRRCPAVRLDGDRLVICMDGSRRSVLAEPDVCGEASRVLLEFCARGMRASSIVIRCPAAHAVRPMWREILGRLLHEVRGSGVPVELDYTS